MATAKKTKKTAAKKGTEAAKKRPLKAAAKSAPQKPKRTKRVSFKKEMSRILLDAKKKILLEFSQKVKSESEEHKRETGDIYDLASTERERELKLVLGDRDRKKLTEIDHALERINEGSYGTCEECGEPIAENRLRILPFTRVCVDCQSHNEREQKIRGGVEEEAGFGIVERHDTEEDLN